MALTFTPYRFYGLRDSFRTKYRIDEGYAEILKLRLSGWLVVQRLPLEDISTKIEGTNSQKLLGRGNIKITTVSGETMLWENLKKIKTVQDALYNWKTLDVPSPAEISESKLKTAKKTHQTDFGTYQNDGTKAEDTRIETPVGTFVCHHDGTFSDLTNRLMWIQAYWGMTYNGKKFEGEPIKLSWHDATKLFGFGGTLPERAGLSKEFIESHGHKEYKRGNCMVTFAGHSDWRLPTAKEILTIGFCSTKAYYWEKDESEYDGYHNPYDTNSLKLRQTLFPDYASQYMYSVWSANDNGYYAWLYDNQNTLGDYKKEQEFPILLVRHF